MRYSTLLASIAVALLPYQTVTQTDKRIQRKDSVTVSAGIPKEQLALEDQLNGIVSQGDQLLRQGDARNAIKQYQNALDLVHKQPLLAEREPWAQKKLAGGYMQANRASDAVPIYVKLLDAKKGDCDSESAAVSNCADAQYDLALARMGASDFSVALTLLDEADTNYAKAERFSADAHEFAMIQRKNQGQVKVISAVVLFRTGKSADALRRVESAIADLRQVQADETLLVGIRDDAGRSLQQAETILARMKSTQ
jgi:tetratricopeptide (TPR) repeat protein